MEVLFFKWVYSIGRRAFRRRLPVRTAAFVFLLVATATTMVNGQAKFTPDHPEVQKAAKAGVEYLSAHLPQETGEAILAGIATIEFYKRYENYVPVDHITVQHALAQTNEAMANQESPLRNDFSVYAPALAIILYCECDDEKFAPKIQELLGALLARQNADGSYGYLGEDGIGDTSQTQYVSLAMWVADSHGFNIAADQPKKTLEWLCNSQSQQGSWFYKVRNLSAFGTNPQHSLSIHCSGLGSVYLLSDYLKLSPSLRSFRQSSQVALLDLPPSVSIARPAKDNARTAELPVKFNSKLLSQTKADGNSWLKDHWTVDSDRWNYYYLYALERYAYFRESAEGSVAENSDWYDQGVEHLFLRQSAEGFWPAGSEPHETGDVNTALAVMFLVRSSQLLVMEPGTSITNGSYGIPEDVTLVFDGGNIIAIPKIGGVEDLKEWLKRGEIGGDVNQVMDAMRDAISQMSSSEGATRTEYLALLRSLVADPIPERRMVAIRLLASTQELESAPALIYALDDPVREVRHEAHNGLRLISRKIDSMRVSADPTFEEFVSLKSRWADWYLRVNPGGTLLE
jgi:hypothetical protein